MYEYTMDIMYDTLEASLEGPDPDDSFLRSQCTSEGSDLKFTWTSCV